MPFKGASTVTVRASVRLLQLLYCLGCTGVYSTVVLRTALRFSVIARRFANLESELLDLVYFARCSKSARVLEAVFITMFPNFLSWTPVFSRVCHTEQPIPCHGLGV